MDAYRLTTLTHHETPWLEARGGLKNGERCVTVITHAAMAEYYGGFADRPVRRNSRWVGALRHAPACPYISMSPFRGSVSHSHHADCAAIHAPVADRIVLRDAWGVRPNDEKRRKEGSGL